MEKFKTKKITIIVAISVLLFIIIGILLFIKTDFLKSNKLLFEKYLLSLGSQIVSFNLEPYTDVFERINKEKVEIIVETESNDNVYIEYDESSKIVTTDTIKLDNENFEITHNIKNNDNDFFYMNILKNDNFYGAYIPELYDKYIALENKDLIKVIENTEIEIAEEISENMSEIIPESIPRPFFNNDEINKIKEILTKYAMNIFNQIDKKSYTKEKYVEEISGKKHKGNKYVLTLSEDEASDIMLKSMKEIMNDEELTNVLKENIFGMAINGIKSIVNNFSSNIDLEESYTEQYNDLNVFETVEPNDEETKKENTNEIKISLYEYKGKTIKIQIDKSEGKLTELITSSDNIIVKNVIEKIDEYNIAYENVIELSNNFEKNNGEIVLKVKTNYLEDTYEDTETSFKILTNIENNIINTNFALDMGDSLFNDYIKLPKITTKFDSNLQIGKMTDENRILVNDYSKEDFKALKKTLLLKAKERYEQNADSLVSNYYKEILEMIDYTRERLSSKFKTTLDSLLNEYKKELERNENANLGDFLSVEKIKEELGYLGKEIDEMTLITGNIMKVIIDDNLYFVQINIDGNTLELIDSICIYVEEELLATEEYLTENLNYQRQLEKTEKIKKDKEYIDEKARDVIESILEDYEDSLEYEDTENFYEFLKRSNLKYRMFFVDEVELIDEKTIMCKKGRDTYFIIFNVDLVEYKLIDMQVFYSEDGTLENLR